MKYPYYKIEEIKKGFWVYRFNSPNDKELIWILNTKQEAEDRIKKRIINNKNAKSSTICNIKKELIKWII